MSHSVRLLFLYGSLDSHPFFPSPAALGHCVLSAAAACVPAGAVFVFAEPSSWHTGVVLAGAGVISRFLLPTPLCSLVAHLPRCVSVGMWSSGLLFFTGPWTVTRSSLHMLRRVAVF